MKTISEPTLGIRLRIPTLRARNTKRSYLRFPSSLQTCSSNCPASRPNPARCTSSSNRPPWSPSTPRGRPTPANIRKKITFCKDRDRSPFVSWQNHLDEMLVMTTRVERSATLRCRQLRQLRCFAMKPAKTGKIRRVRSTNVGWTRARNKRTSVKQRRRENENERSIRERIVDKSRMHTFLYTFYI